jgi:hypothetical protein
MLSRDPRWGMPSLPESESYSYSANMGKAQQGRGPQQYGASQSNATRRIRKDAGSPLLAMHCVVHDMLTITLRATSSNDALHAVMKSR